MTQFAIVLNHDKQAAMYPVALETPLERFPLTVEELKALRFDAECAILDLDPNFNEEHFK